MMNDTPATAADLASLIAAMEATEGEDCLHIPEGWLQGRTAYGGLSAALALAAVLRRWDDLPPLRSAQITFIGPVAGRVRIRTELLRRGRSAAFVQADVLSDEGLGLRATFVFMHPRDSHVDYPARDPDGEVLPAKGEPFAPPAAVAFAQNFEFRATGAEAPGVPHISRWARLRGRDGLHPMVELLAVGDVLPPAAMMLFTKFGPISSMTWQINLLSDRPSTVDGWWLVRATADHAQQGSSSQHMSIRNAHGVLVATATQSVALFA